MTEIVRAACPIERPYTLLFLSLRAQVEGLIERMEQASGRDLTALNRVMVVEEWEAYDTGLITGRIDWDDARIVFTWAVNEDAPEPASRSPEFILDLSELKQAALAAEEPRAWFESYALFVLDAAQDHLGDFFRDGPTDDIPFYRHLVYARGITGADASVWIRNVLFSYDDRHK